MDEGDSRTSPDSELLLTEGGGRTVKLTLWVKQTEKNQHAVTGTVSGDS